MYYYNHLFYDIFYNVFTYICAFIYIKQRISSLTLIKSFQIKIKSIKSSLLLLNQQLWYSLQENFFNLNNLCLQVENISLKISDHNEVIQFCKKQKIDIVIVGPEDPLASGLADSLKKADIPCFGPSKNAARLESDKAWAKSFMDKYNIPTAKWKSFTEAKEAKKFIEK